MLSMQHAQACAGNDPDSIECWSSDAASTGSGYLAVSIIILSLHLLLDIRSSEGSSPIRVIPTFFNVRHREGPPVLQTALAFKLPLAPLLARNGAIAGAVRLILFFALLYITSALATLVPASILLLFPSGLLDAEGWLVLHTLTQYDLLGSSTSEFTFTKYIYRNDGICKGLLGAVIG
jgi:hypothetical protein